MIRSETDGNEGSACYEERGRTPSPSEGPVLRNAPLAQLDRASDYGSEGREFESLRAHQKAVRGHSTDCGLSYLRLCGAKEETT